MDIVVGGRESLGRSAGRHSRGDNAAARRGSLAAAPRRPGSRGAPWARGPTYIIVNNHTQWLHEGGVLKLTRPGATRASRSTPPVGPRTPGPIPRTRARPGTPSIVVPATERAISIARSPARRTTRRAAVPTAVRTPAPRRAGGHGVPGTGDGAQRGGQRVGGGDGGPFGGGGGPGGETGVARPGREVGLQAGDVGGGAVGGGPGGPGVAVAALPVAGGTALRDGGGKAGEEGGGGCEGGLHCGCEYTGCDVCCDFFLDFGFGGFVCGCIVGNQKVET